MSLAEQQAALFSKLDELGIKTKTIEHAQCFTAEDVERYAFPQPEPRMFSTQRTIGAFQRG
jgi:hypothetical protein